jgi:hypothetical protein
VATKTVNMKDLASELGAFSEAHMVRLKKATVRGVARSIPDLVAASPVDTGLYAASWDFTETEESVILGNYAPYAGIIEYGARPHYPPIAPLLAWAKRVLQDPSQPPNYSDRVWALAKHVQQKIGREGVQPRHVMQNTLPKIIENIKAEYEAASGE